MTSQDVHVSSASRTLAILDRGVAARTVAEMSGVPWEEINRDLRGGITFVCGGLTFTPDIALPRVLEERVTRPLGEVERAPFPTGRKA